jgi:hypothetical protein
MTREQIMKNALQFKVGIIRVLSPYVQMLLVCILYVKSKDILRKRKKQQFLSRIRPNQCYKPTEDRVNEKTQSLDLTEVTTWLYKWRSN